MDAARILSLTVLFSLAMSSCVSAAKVNTSIAVFKDDAFGDCRLADLAGATLESAGMRVEYLDAGALTGNNRLSTANYSLLVYANGKRYPASFTRNIESYLKSGGHLLTLGGPPLTNPAWKIGESWYTQDQFPELVEKAAEKNLLYDFESDIQGKAWSRGTNSKSSSSVSIVAADSPAGRSLQIDIKDLTGWDNFSKPVRNLSKDHDSIFFYAKGDDRTNQFAMELREKDGSRWIATINIGTRWKSFLFNAQDFKYWPDNPSKGRGGSGDRVNLGNVNQISIGLANSHTTVGDGDHRFWIDQISSARNPVSDAKANQITLDTLTPEYKLFPVTGTSRVKASLNQLIAGQDAYPVPKDVFSCSPRPQGTGYLKSRRARFIPILDAYDDTGSRSGYVAWAVVNGRNEGVQFPGSSWAVFGTNDLDFYKDPSVQKCVVQAAKRLTEDLWLFDGGSQFYTYFKDAETVTLGASVLPEDAVHTGLSVDIGITDASPSHNSVYNTRLPIDQPDEPTAETTWSPNGFSDGPYIVTTTLLQDGVPIDILRHPLGAWEPKPLQDRDYMTVKDGGFFKDGKQWYAHGINYMPSSGIALEDGEAFEYWLEDRAYDPDIIEEDLSRIESMGFNMVSVFIYRRSLESMNLLDFLTRCEKHNLLVNLSLRPHANPLDFDEYEVREIIDEYQLSANDTVMAYDLAWERSWGYYEPNYTNTLGRKGYDPQWLDWIVQRYGSLENAEKDWGFKCPRTPGGDITGPSDQQLRTNGKWTVMVAAYRRFVDDYVGKQHSMAVAAIKRSDPNHLISFRMSGDAGDPTADPASFGYDFRGLARSMDIMEPEGYGRIGSWDRVKDGVFTAFYSRYAAPGRPLLWAEFGKHVWTGSNFAPGSQTLADQGAFYDSFYKMAAMSKADGSVAWWFPGGFRVGENSDYGVANPDGSSRPSTEAIRNWSAKIKGQGPLPEVDYWITVDRDADARGLFGIYESVKNRFWQALEEGKWPGLRDAGTGTTSADTPPIAVGNTIYNGSNPPKYLNAEFRKIEVLNGDSQWEEVADGSAVYVEKNKPITFRGLVSNTQVARWLAPKAGSKEIQGSVYLGIKEGINTIGFLPILSDAGYLLDAEIPECSISFGITEDTDIVLQMTAKDRMWFGEKISLTLLHR